jgi:ABC-type multidrug transport system fused ATPase/permease subunit
LRLLELESGKIEIDGIDIKQVGLDLLRRRCFIAISQDPLILPNETLRFNLDPDGSEPDDVLVAALTTAGLWSHFFECDTHLSERRATVINIPGSYEHPILDRKVTLFHKLSAGQCQLLSVCRALVKASSLRHSRVKPVIILDEVTSCLDAATESSINHIIDDEFSENGHTIIIVTHRLGALEGHIEAGRDVVALMADGKLQEVIEDVGPAMFQRFREME